MKSEIKKFDVNKFEVLTNEAQALRNAYSKMLMGGQTNNCFGGNCAQQCGCAPAQK